MDRTDRPSTYDRDLDLNPHRASAPTEPIDRYRRLVLNPLLAVASCVLAFMLLRTSLKGHNLAVFLAALGLVSVSIFFTQYHCLDCGVTGWLLNEKRHACAPAVARWREGVPGRWRFPGLKMQLMLWLYFLASVTSLSLILYVFSK